MVILCYDDDHDDDDFDGDDKEGDDNDKDQPCQCCLEVLHR